MKLSTCSVIGLLIQVNIFTLQFGAECQEYCSRQNFLANDRAKLKRCEAKLDNFKRLKNELLNLLDDKNKMGVKVKKLEKELKSYKNNQKSMMDQIICLNIGKTESETKLRRLMKTCTPARTWEYKISTDNPFVPFQPTKLPNWVKKRPVNLADYVDDPSVPQSGVTSSTQRPMGAVPSSNLLGGKPKTIYYVNPSDPSIKKEILINYRPFRPNLRAPIDNNTKDIRNGIVRTGPILTEIYEQGHSQNITHTSTPHDQESNVKVMEMLKPLISSFKRSMILENELCQNELSDVTIQLENCTLDKIDKTRDLNKCRIELTKSNQFVQNLTMTAQKCESEVIKLNSTLLDCQNGLFSKQIEMMALSGVANETRDLVQDLESRLDKCLMDKESYKTVNTQCEQDLSTFNITLTDCDESVFNLTSQLSEIQRELNASKIENTNLTQIVSDLEDDVSNLNNSLNLRMSLLDKMEEDCKKSVGSCVSDLKKLTNGGVYYLHTDPTTKKSWKEACDFCVSCGMELVHIDDQQEHDVIAKFIISSFRSSSPPVWIGLSRDHSDLVAGLASQEKCMELVRSGENSTLGWDNKDCSVKQHFICEVTSPCNFLFSHGSDVDKRVNLVNQTDKPTENKTLFDSSCYVGHIMVKHSNPCTKTKMTLS